jgi:hypothetical protein
MTNRWASCFGRALCRTKHSGAAEGVASLNVDCVGTRRLARGGSRTLAVIVQSKVIAVTDGGPDRFTVADAPEIVRRSMARANHVGLPLKRSYAVNPNTVHERNWRRRFPAACFPSASPKALWKRASFPECDNHLYFKAFWSGRRDSNPRPQPWQGSCPFVLN